MSCPAVSLGNTQPQVLVYTGVFCAGSSGVIYPGTSNVIPATLGVKNIKSLRVPGNVTAQVTTVTGQSANLVGGTYTDIVSQLGGAVANISVNAPTKSWDQFLADCCSGVGDASICGTYWNNGPSCTGLAQSHGCSSNVSDPKCRALCLTTPGACDDAARAWCRANPNDPFCACLTSSDSNPWCTDSKCILSGYKPGTSIGKTGANCPSYVDCKQKQTANDSSSQWFNLQLAFCNGVDANGLYQILLLIVVIVVGGYLAYNWLSDGGDGYGYQAYGYPQGYVYPPAYAYY